MRFAVFKKYLLPLLLFMFIMAAAALISREFKRVENEADTFSTVKKVSPAPPAIPENYSRISFFHTQEVSGSLAIPESWEGKYRMKELGRQVNFFYIGEPENEQLLFIIKLYNEEEWEKEKLKTSGMAEKIGQKNGYVFTYVINSMQISSTLNQEYKTMGREVEKIMNSIKLK